MSPPRDPHACKRLTAGDIPGSDRQRSSWPSAIRVANLNRSTSFSLLLLSVPTLRLSTFFRSCCSSCRLTCGTERVKVRHPDPDAPKHPCQSSKPAQPGPSQPTNLARASSRARARHTAAVPGNRNPPPSPERGETVACVAVVAGKKHRHKLH